jgi:glyoxylase-like metal-dependent hydrolase (beta-lactamase superfamily II)
MHMTAARGHLVSEAVLAFTVGSLKCRVVPDGIATYKRDSWYSDLPDEELDSSVPSHPDYPGLVRVPYHPILLQTADGLALVDAGAGPTLAEEWGEPVGHLRQALQAANVEPDDVGLVLLSHAHPDHIGGLTVEEEGGRRPLFRNARHVISQTELAFWMSDRVPDDFAGMATLARVQLEPLERAGILDPIDGEPELAPGIRIIPAPGHTPGHLAVAVSSGSDTALLVADAVLGETNLEHPDWSSRLEVDRAGAVRTRRMLLDRAASDGSTVVGYHLWRPGLVKRRGQRYQWNPMG